MFEVLAGLFLLPWWGFLILSAILLMDLIALSDDSNGWGTAIVIVGVYFLFMGAANTNLLTAVWNNPGTALNFFLVYFGIGGAWSVAKWYLFLLNVRDRLVEETKGWAARTKIIDDLP